MYASLSYRPYEYVVVVSIVRAARTFRSVRSLYPYSSAFHRSRNCLCGLFLSFSFVLLGQFVRCALADWTNCPIEYTFRYALGDFSSVLSWTKTIDRFSIELQHPKSTCGFATGERDRRAHFWHAVCVSHRRIVRWQSVFLLYHYRVFAYPPRFHGGPWRHRTRPGTHSRTISSVRAVRTY